MEQNNARAPWKWSVTPVFWVAVKQFQNFKNYVQNIICCIIFYISDEFLNLFSNIAESVVYNSVWPMWMKYVRLGDWVFLCTHLKQQHRMRHVRLSLFLLTQCLKSPNKEQFPYHYRFSVTETYEILRQKVCQGNSIPSNDKAIYFMSPKGFP